MELSFNGIYVSSPLLQRNNVFFLFRFNKFILNAFSHYKASLPLYTDAELEFPGVEIHELTFQSTGAHSANQLITFMEKSEIGLTGYLSINLACLSVCSYPINVKTAEPIGPKFVVGHHVTTGHREGL